MVLKCFSHTPGGATFSTHSVHIQYRWRVVGAGGCLVVVTQWRNTSHTSQVSWVWFTVTVISLFHLITIASFPGLPYFYLLFVFTIVHGSGRPANFCWSSDSVYYCERKREIKTGEAWDQGYLKTSKNSWFPAWDKMDRGWPEILSISREHMGSDFNALIFKSSDGTCWVASTCVTDTFQYRLCSTYRGLWGLVVVQSLSHVACRALVAQARHPGFDFQWLSAFSISFISSKISLL